MRLLQLFKGFGPTSIVTEVLEELARDRRFGGLIPVPDVRAACVQRGLTQAQVDTALLWLDREFLIDLKVPNDPHLTAGGRGIHVPGRGSHGRDGAYFVVLR